MAALFDIKNVSYPSTIKTKTKFSVTGDVKLFGIPFYGLLWVGVTITYPKSWWQLLGAAETTAVAVAKLGKFGADFADGFTKEGDYTIDIRAWLGPTILTSVGPLTSETVTIPPFPTMVILSQKKFTVAGQGGGTTGQALAFHMDNPTINPSTVEIGKQTTITLPVKNVGTNDQTFSVKIEITEMGWSDIAGPGSVVGSQTFGPYTLKSGDTQNVVMTWTATGATKGKWIRASVLVNDELAPNTSPDNPEIFKQEFEVIVTATGTSITLGKPSASPYSSTPGTVTITCPVISASATTVTVRCLVYQGSALFGAGDLLWQGDQAVTFVAGETKQVQFSYQSSYLSGQSKRDIGVEVYYGGQKVKDGQWPDIFYVTQASSGGGGGSTTPTNDTISLEIEHNGIYDPLPANNIAIGNGIAKIHCLVKWTENTTNTRVARATYHVTGPGSLDFSDDNTDHYANPNQTTDIYSGKVFSIAVAGTYTVTGVFYLDGTQVATATSTFTVAGGGGAATLSASYSNGAVNWAISGFTPGATITLNVVGGGSFTVVANSNGAQSGAFYDSDPAGTYTLKAVDSSGKSATATFTISGSSAPTLSASYSGGVVSFSFTGFGYLTAVTISVMPTGGYIIVIADANGAGNGAFTDNDPAGTYTLKASDAYGLLTATATFTISGGGVVSAVVTGASIECSNGTFNLPVIISAGTQGKIHISIKNISSVSEDLTGIYEIHDPSGAMMYQESKNANSTPSNGSADIYPVFETYIFNTIGTWEIRAWVYIGSTMMDYKSFELVVQ